MANFYNLVDSLRHRFKNVPNVEQEDCEEWVRTAISRHGVPNNDPDRIPHDEEHLIILLGEAIGAKRIALDTGHYFRYQDGDEVVDKTEVSQHWLRMANSFELDYRRQNSMKGKNVRYRVARRLDRDF
jgi:hypothetical protein